MGAMGIVVEDAVQVGVNECVGRGGVTKQGHNNWQRGRGVRQGSARSTLSLPKTRHRHPHDIAHRPSSWTSTPQAQVAGVLHSVSATRARSRTSLKVHPSSSLP